MRKLHEGAAKLNIGLSDKQLGQFERYYHELIAWNKKFNLTAITDYDEVQIKHFLDSLTVASVLSREETEKPDFNIIDVGSGAGFPGIPLKILLPEVKVVLVESATKKAAFLGHVIQQLELKDVEVLNCRAEEAAHLSTYREGFALVVSRAVAALPVLVELTLPFCRIGGRFIAQKKGEVGEEIEKAQTAITTMGGQLTQVRKIEMEEFGDTRYLLIIDKICSTPSRYPRRPGIPRRRPILSGRQVEEVNERVA